METKDSLWTQCTFVVLVCSSESSYQLLRGITGESAGKKHERWLLTVSFTVSPGQRLRVTVNRKEAIVQENCLKHVRCSPCRVEALFVVWKAWWQLKLFHQFRVCVYIYIRLQCGMLSYLEEHVLQQLMYVDKMGSVRKDQVLIFPHFIVSVQLVVWV